MQTIEEPPPQQISEINLEESKMAHSHPDTAPPPRGSLPMLRVLFWAFLIFAVVVIGAIILALPMLTLC